MERDFPDKKQRLWHPNQVDEVLVRAREIQDSFEIGQKEATFVAYPEYGNIPIALALMTDSHYGSIRSNTQLINRHLQIIDETPNFYLAHDGDHVNNFNAALGRLATGMFEDPVHPQIVSRAWAEKLKALDDKNKIAVLGFGNHDDFAEHAGQDWYDTFLGKMKCPIFTSGGLLHILVGGQHYEMAMTHEYWGVSKLNPTNACKRFLEHEYPTADIAFLGHTHQSEGLQFERGGIKRVAVIGGTYKDEDIYARKRGIGGRSGTPGWVIFLYPDVKKMQLFSDIEVAQQVMTSFIFNVEANV
jgi:predicted phosphodiesterase